MAPNRPFCPRPGRSAPARTDHRPGPPAPRAGSASYAHARPGAHEHGSRCGDRQHRTGAGVRRTAARDRLTGDRRPITGHPEVGRVAGRDRRIGRLPSLVLGGARCGGLLVGAGSVAATVARGPSCSAWPRALYAGRPLRPGPRRGGQPAASPDRDRTRSSSRRRLPSSASPTACSPGSCASSKKDRCTITSLGPLSMPDTWSQPA